MVIYIYYLLREVAITPQQYRARSFLCNHFLSRNMLINSDKPIFHALSLKAICAPFFFCLITQQFFMVSLSFSRLQNSLFSPQNRFFKAPALCEIFVSRVEPRTPRKLLLRSTRSSSTRKRRSLHSLIFKSHEMTTPNIEIAERTIKLILKSPYQLLSKQRFLS